MISEARKLTPLRLRVPIRPTVADCVRCERPIRPGELYAVLNEGPMHFGCHEGATAQTVAGTRFKGRRVA